MAEEFIPEQISDYCNQYTSEESSLLALIDAETHAEVHSPRMLSGKLQGRFLSMLSKLIKPKYVLEIGTYTGYSALCFAEGLASDGVIYTLDKDLKLEQRVRGYFARSGYASQIQYILGEAREIIPTLSCSWDLVFIDADKSGYSLYYDLVIENLRPGGLIIADNVLWKGKVAEPEAEFDKQTRHLHEFNQKIAADTRVEQVLLPVRDGLMLITKK